MPENRKFWFTLDNAAKIFPAIISNEVTSVFRLTVVLKQPVRLNALSKAVLKAEKRYPYFRVQLKEGFFWYYLEHLPRHFSIEPDLGPPYCAKFPRGSLLLRILVKDNRLSVEFSHILTDGGGGLQFLKTVLELYSDEYNTESQSQYLPGSDPVSEEEYEDAYKRYFKEEIPAMVKRSHAYHIPFPLAPVPRFSIRSTVFSLAQIKQIARDKAVSITVYLVAVYLFILQDIHEELNSKGKHARHKKIRIQVPMDLRKIFPSKTMRNFSLFVMPEIDLRLGHYSFDEIIKAVYHQVQLETDEKLINKNISRNVGGEKKTYVRGIPLFLKSLILRITFYSLGTSQYSGVITNLGKIILPPKTGEITDYFIFTPPPPNKMLKINCGVIGFGDKLVLEFGNITDSDEFENKFLRFINEQIRLVRPEMKG